MSLEPDVPSAQCPKVRNKIPRFATLRTIIALVLREMSTSYGRSPGGYAWAILEPAASIALLSAIFSLGFRSPALGISFPMFYATGVLPFMLFNDIAAKLGQSLNYSKQLLAYPRVTFVDALVARFAINLITHLLVNYIIIIGVLTIMDTRVTPDLATIARAYILTALLALGIGTLNCYLLRRFEIYQRAWAIFTRPLFLLSCVFFLFETVPQPYRDYLWYNPLVHVIGLMRRGFYASYDAPYVSELYVVMVSLITLVVGLLLLRRDHKSTMER